MKIGGERAYRRARRGVEVEMPLRRSTVHALDVIAYTGDSVTLDLRVSSGTYIRAVADALGGHCRTLRRTEVGPFAVVDAITSALASLGDSGEGVAVRSSAAGEDSEISFAGQFESFLNVRGPDVVEAWKKVVRSRFAPRAVFYRRALGIAEVDTPMSVLVQRMVRPRSSGGRHERNLQSHEC